MGLRLERYWPLIAAAAVGAAWHYFKVPLPADEKEFLAAAISLGAVLTGFVATAQAILMALPSDSVMARIRTSGYLDDLIRYIAHALNGTLLFSLFSLAGFFMLRQGARLPQWYSTTWIVVAVFAGAAFYRVTKILLKIMRH